MRIAAAVLALVVGCAGTSTPGARDGGAPAPTVARPGAAARGPRGPMSAPAAAAPASLPTAGRCNTPERTERFARCRAARDAAACRAAGGTWGAQGSTRAPSCACPTGQGGCPCKREGDCLVGCRAPMALNASRENRCRAMWQSCAPMWPPLGCWCWFGPDGQPVERCSE